MSDGVSEGGSGGAPHCEGHEEHDAGTRGEDEHREEAPLLLCHVGQHPDE